MTVQGKRVVLITRAEYDLAMCWISPEAARKLIAKKRSKT
jgi:hypothetical protein